MSASAGRTLLISASTGTVVTTSASASYIAPVSVSTGTVYDFPPDLPLWRAQLFALAEPLTLSGAEWETYWPWIDNVWSYKRKYVSQSTTTIYYNCRRWRKTWAPEDGEKRVRKRLKPTRESIQCKAQLKAVWENGVVILSRVDLSCDHLDSLEDADYAKRPSEFGRIAALYLQKGFSLAEVSHGVRALDDPILRQILQNIGGGHLTHKDLANAGRLTSKNTRIFVALELARQQSSKDLKLANG